MLDWLTSEQQSHYAEDSRLVDGPETPAPVFALRAFKSLFHGSPSKEEQKEPHTRINSRQHAGDSRKSRRRSLPETSPSKSIKRPSLEALMRSPTKMGGSDSPMKSILLSSPRKAVTPGTKKKNVSFREALHATNGRTGKPAGLSDSEKSGLGKSTKARISLKSVGSAREGPRKEDGNSITIKQTDAPKSDITNSLGGHETSRRQTEGQRNEGSQSSNAELDTPIVPSESDIDKVLSSGTSPAYLPPPDTTVMFNEEMSDYMSRTNREVRKLVKAIKSTRSFARKKDQEATELSAKLAKKSAQNQRLQAQNKEMKEKLKDLEEKLAKMQGLCSIRSEKAASKEGAIDIEPANCKPHGEIRQMTKSPLPEASGEGTLDCHTPVPESVISVPKHREVHPNFRESSNLNEIKPDVGKGSSPMRLSSANARIRMAPERFEAAKARLRVKSEERKKAIGSSPLDKENA